LPGGESSFMAKIRVHIWVAGRVQGVYFRNAIEEEARDRGVTGWIRNLADGRVEGVFEGEEDRVRELMGFCQRGPPHARVDRIEVREEPFRGESRGFEIRY
jgi:acylphosphatase